MSGIITTCPIIIIVYDLLISCQQDPQLFLCHVFLNISIQVSSKLSFLQPFHMLKMAFDHHRWPFHGHEDHWILIQLSTKVCISPSDYNIEWIHKSLTKICNAKYLLNRYYGISKPRMVQSNCIIQYGCIEMTVMFITLKNEKQKFWSRFIASIKRIKMKNDMYERNIIMKDW